MSPRDLLDRLINGNKTAKKSSSLKTLFILLILGIGLMVLSHIFGAKTHDSPASSARSAKPASVSEDVAAFKSHEKKTFDSMQEYAVYYEESLKEILGKIMGVSDVDVMITLETDAQNVYEKDAKTDQSRTSEEDHSGGTRDQSETSRDEKTVIVDANNKGPIIVTRKSPIIRGVVIVADGVQNPTVKSWVIDAASSVLDIPSYRVVVVPGKQKEGS
ncbi:stage III sporulation protein AG [Caenibacillus caldisaponilyticus]|uniref:stage III sporulation protein AG n=1 Tax=Caenibacillus caldisaponilyticus TaxID=1674942 RepID=UPI0009885124|nr:stage III sporulation protein AG [Caenibacillus caldisaponilyticus]